MGAYQTAYEEARRSPEQFWRRAAEDILWERPFDRVFDGSIGPAGQWFPGGMLNTCRNAVDRHVASGQGDRVAVIHESPVTGLSRTLTYRELLKEVATFAGVMASLGITKGDRVVIYMPMVPETLIAMLACARIGAIHSVVFGGFASKELASRIDDATPKLIVSASCGIEGTRIIDYKPLLEGALALSRHTPDRCIILQRPQQRFEPVPGRDVDWQEAMSNASPADCVSVAATDPLYILYTSGTTGKPKGIIRDNGGHAVALKWSMRFVFDVQPGETVFTSSDFGWTVGHSYIAYAPLLHGCSTVIYEGKPVGTPDPGQFWRIVERYKVRMLFTAPTALRAIKREDAAGNYLRPYDISSLRSLFLAGERLDPDTYHWALGLLQRPVVDHWWQTETGWPAASNCLGLEVLPFKPGSPTAPVPGYSIEILDENGKPAPANKEGSVVIRLPLPPGSVPTLWNDDARFRETYLSRYPGYYLTGDGGYIDEDGYLFVMGRTDDIIIVAGHNLSTGSLEEALASHPDVAECAVFGVKDALKTQVPVALVVLKAGVSREHPILAAELVQVVREQVGAVANLKQVGILARLPKTRSGKVLRGTMKRIANSEPYQLPPTIDDPGVLDDVRSTLQNLGYARG